MITYHVYLHSAFGDPIDLYYGTDMDQAISTQDNHIGSVLETTWESL